MMLAFTHAYVIQQSELPNWDTRVGMIEEIF